MFTEDEAKKKICCGPMILANATINGEMIVDGFGPATWALCAGSACMAWRWADKQVEQKVIHTSEQGFWKGHGYRYVVSYDDNQVLMERCKSTAPAVGYCGLAGAR